MQMNYTFSIESRNYEENRIFVVYTVPGSKWGPFGAWVVINPDSTAEMLHQSIRSSFPAFKWIVAIDPAKIDTLVDATIPMGNTGSWSYYETQPGNQVQSMLADRRIKLIETDWTQLPDTKLTEKQKQEYATYRQALRDVTNHPNWPDCGFPDLVFSFDGPPPDTVFPDGQNSTPLPT